jgi:hypothetical protein
MNRYIHKYRHWIALALIGAFAFIYSRQLYAPCDDAYIFLVYAKNWLAGNGPTFNGAVVEGFSSPLWLGLITFTGLTGIPLPALMQILSTLSGLFAIYATYRLAEALSGSPDWAIIAPLILVATGDFAFYMGVGLEEVLFAALLALAATVIIKNAESSLSTLKLPVLLALSILTRPEGALFAALFLLWSLTLVRKLWPPVRTGLWLTAFITPLMILRRVYYGYWLPNTYYVKANAGLANFTKGKIYLAQNAPRYAVIVGILALLLLSAILMKRWMLIWRGLPLLLISGIWGSYLLISGGDNLVGGRVLIPALPLVLAALTALIAATLGNLRSGLILAILIGAAGIIGYAQSSIVQDHIARWQRNFPIRQAAGVYLRDNFPKDTLVALNPAGIIPYYSELPTLDMLGLNDEYIGQHGHRDFTLDFGHQAGDGDYILAQQPGVILFGGGVAKQPSALLSDRQIAVHPDFEAFYTRATWPGIGYAFIRNSD